MRFALFSLILAATLSPTCSAQTESCTNVLHDGQSVSVCVVDARYGDTPACPGHFDFTGATVGATHSAGSSQVGVGGYSLRCTDGDSSDGLFVYEQTVGPGVFVAWEEFSGGGYHDCWITHWVGGNGGGPACPIPPPNPGWGHLLP